MNSVEKEKSGRWFRIVCLGSYIEVLTDDIIALEATSNYTIIYLVGGKQARVSYHLGKLEKRLLVFGCFIRPNRKYLINAQFIKRVEKAELQFEQQKVGVSRRRAVQVHKQIRSFNPYLYV